MNHIRYLQLFVRNRWKRKRTPDQCLTFSITFVSATVSVTAPFEPSGSGTFPMLPPLSVNRTTGDPSSSLHFTPQTHTGLLPDSSSNPGKATYRSGSPKWGRGRPRSRRRCSDRSLRSRRTNTEMYMVRARIVHNTRKNIHNGLNDWFGLRIQRWTLFFALLSHAFKNFFLPVVISSCVHFILAFSKRSCKWLCSCPVLPVRFHWHLVGEIGTI